MQQSTSGASFNASEIASKGVEFTTGIGRQIRAYRDSFAPDASPLNNADCLTSRLYFALAGVRQLVVVLREKLKTRPSGTVSVSVLANGDPSFARHRSTVT